MPVPHGRALSGAAAPTKRLLESPARIWRLFPYRNGEVTRMLMQTIFRTARTLARNPGFAAVVIFTLALGVGANTPMFNVVNAILLPPLPARDPKNFLVLTPHPPAKDLFSNTPLPPLYYF